MKYLYLLPLFLWISLVTALPVTKIKKDTKEEPEPVPKEYEETGSVLEYERYLKEIVEALESDAEFRKKLDNASETDIKSGKIALELQYVSHNIRSKLDEIKRREIGRLLDLKLREAQLSNDINQNHLKEYEHLNHENLRTFEVDDLEKLIKKTAQDLSESDRRRREDFKQYELEKEYEKQQALQAIKDEEARKKKEEELKQLREKHNQHQPLHHPGNQAQLEEVWKEQDHMEGQDFDPRAFFMMHDLDGNGYWDETEVKALFVKELDKVYQAGLPEDDLRERAEEMERMREHVFQESDTDRDRLISFKEFLDQTKRDEFRQDPGWDTVDNIPQFTHEEFMEFQKRKDEENATAHG